MSTSGSVRTSASHATAPRKGRQDVGAFREASQPVGGTRAHSLDVHVGHPWPPFTARARRFALQAALAFGARSWARAPPTSSNVVRTWKPGAEATGPAESWTPHPLQPTLTASRRQDDLHHAPLENQHSRLASCPLLTAKTAMDGVFAIKLSRGGARVVSAASGRCPCHLAGRSLRTSCPSLTRRKLRFAIPAALSFQRRSIGMGNAPHPFNP